MRSSAGAKPQRVSGATGALATSCSSAHLHVPQSCNSSTASQHMASWKKGKGETKHQGVTEQRQGCYFRQSPSSLPGTAPHSCCSSSERSASSVPGAAPARRTCSNVGGFTATVANPSLLGPPLGKASPAYQWNICCLTLAFPLKLCRPLLGSTSSHGTSALRCVGTKA